MLSKSFDIQKFLRSLKEFDAIPESKAAYTSAEIETIDSILLDKNKRIKVGLSRIFSQILSEISNYSIAMNSSISDTKIEDEFKIDGDERFTPSTWGGRGDKINKDIQSCLDSLSKLLNPNFSALSHFEFSDNISSIIYSELFGKEFIAPSFVFLDEDGKNTFGNFNKLFGFEIESVIWQFSRDGLYWTTIEKNSNIFDTSKIAVPQGEQKLKVRSITKYTNTDNSIIKEYTYLDGDILSPDKYLAGLSFLSFFEKSKNYPKKLYKEYMDGIVFNPPDLFSQASSYVESFSDDSKYLSEFSIGLAEQVDKIKIILKNIELNCDDFGRYPGYEGLGNIKGQIQNLLKIFKPEYLYIFADKITSELLKITSFSNSGSQEILSNLSESLLKIASDLDSLCSSLKRIGTKDGEKIIDRSYLYGANTRDEVVSQLKTLGFNNQQINTILSSKDLSCSFVFLYDELDENDIYSYFKGGRLAEYIFYLGGEEAISETLEFFISKSDIKYFLQLLDKLQKSKDFTISKNRYIYGNILGCFISIFPEAINYLIGPDYKKYQTEIITDLISGGKITRTSSDILELVSKKISDPLEDISFNQALSNSIIIKEFINLLSPAIEDLRDKYKNSNFLSSIDGLSSKELNIILNKTGGRRSYELSGFLSGIEGGRYQSLISGLIHSVLLPKTAPALLPANRRISILGQNKTDVSLEELIFNINSFSIGFKELCSYLINASSGVINNSQIEPEILKSTIYSINKDISFSIDNLSNQNNPEFIIKLRQSLDSEIPGIGGSKEIDSSQKRGVLTPSQSREIESLLGKSISSETYLPKEVTYDDKFFITRDLLSKWIKLDLDSSTFLNGIYDVEKGPIKAINQTNSEFENIKNKLTEYINEGFISSEKTDYLNNNISSKVSKIEINQIEICSKLGKSRDTCISEYANKSKVSSNFGSTLKPSSIPIERPLNVVAESYAEYSNSPGPKMIEELSEGKIKAYALDINSTIGYTKAVDILPSISFKKNLNISSPLNKEERRILASLFDLSNNHLYIEKYSKNSKSTVSDCRLISDPVERQLCLNFIKCVKFKSTPDVRYLNYCPESTPGGRNKKYDS